MTVTQAIQIPFQFYILSTHIINFHFYAITFFFFFLILASELRASHLLGKSSITELYTYLNITALLMLLEKFKNVANKGMNLGTHYQ